MFALDNCEIWNPQNSDDIKILWTQIARLAKFDQDLAHVSVGKLGDAEKTPFTIWQNFLNILKPHHCAKIENLGLGLISIKIQFWFEKPRNK